MTVILAIPDEHIEMDQPLGMQTLSDPQRQPTAILKARRYLHSNLSRAISLQQREHIIQYSDILAILTYLTSEESLIAALEVYSTTMDSKTSGSATDSLMLELVHQSRARLLHFHAIASTSGYRPKEITSTLAESVRIFPSNTIFQSLYHHYNQRSLLTERIRSVVPTLTSALDALGVKESIIPLAFAIWTEISRPSYGGSTKHSIRAAFQRAVDVGTSGCHSLAIWRWYLMWELQVVEDEKEAKKDDFEGSNKLARAQDVFYSGMRACPWAKELYMLAFADERLSGTMGFKGLRKVYETIVEKGLRIHIDLAEVLEEHDAQDGLQVEDGDDVENGGYRLMGN